MKEQQEKMNKNTAQDRVITSKELHRELNEERSKKGLKDVPVINNAAGTSTGNLARMDKSWKSVPDFFRQMIKDKRNK